MRHLNPFLVLFMLITGSARLFPQDDDQDPFLGNYKLAGSDEIILAWGTDIFRNDSSFQKIYDYVGIPFQDGVIERKVKRHETGQTAFFRSRQMDALSGDLNGDALEDVVFTWIGPDTSINVIIPQVDAGSLDWSQTHNVKIKGDGISPHERATHQLRLTGAFLDDDPEQEFVVAYWTEQEKIRLVAFEADANLAPQEKTSIAEVDLILGSDTNVLRFDISGGDFDGDGDDEIILVWWVPNADDTGIWGIAAKVYDYDGETGTLFPRIEAPVYLHANDQINQSHSLNRLAVATGNFNEDTIDEVVFGYQIAESDQPTLVYLQPFYFGDDTLTATFDLIEKIFLDEENRERQERTLGNRGWPMQIITGDLDGNGRDEILSAARNQIKIYLAEAGLSLSQIGSIGISTQPEEDNHRIFGLSDFNAEVSLDDEDGQWIPEIVVVENLEINPGIDPDGELQLRVFEPQLEFVDGVLQSVQGAQRASIRDEATESSSPRPLALAVGDFDGTSVRIGRPSRFSKTDIIQPLVVLNSPPTHFDIFENQEFDVSKCHDENNCLFEATYETETEKTIEVTTQLNRDWATSIEVGGGFSYLGVGVEATLTASYGERFSKSNRNRETFTVSQSISAIFDDWIYATIVDYDIWEYPVIADGGERGHIVVVVPHLQTRAWFPSKSPTATAYLPNHEVGNILSYQEITQTPTENTALAEQVRYNTGDRVTLNDNSNFDWALTAENETETTTERAIERSIGASLDFNIPVPYIPNFSLSGNYSDESISTHSSRVRDRKGLSVHLDAIDLSFGETFYSVTPYAYWAKNGALVLDYAVKPELSSPGGVETWWQDLYGTKPDLALILPWRYDPEKGNEVSDLKRLETKSLLFNPAEPNPGDEVTITARIHNYSLVPVLDPITVRFYSDDPDLGGTLIAEAELTGGLDTRASATLDVTWTLPSELDMNFARIYAVLDPDNTIDEIHQNNNKGWRALVPAGVTSVEVPEPIIKTFELSQNYPNPFNPSTTIRFSIPENGTVTLKIYDLLGREVVTLLNEERPSGTYEVNFDGGELATGIYFYRLQSGLFSKTKKFLLLK